MSVGNSSSYINDEDQNRLVLNSLFSFPNHSKTPKPYRKRNLPDSFYRPPSINTKNKNVHRQHTKSQSNSPDSSIRMKSINNYTHSRTASDTALLTEQSTINSQTSMLPLPDDWEEKQTSDGQIYYIDHISKCTTWIDPRPKHYATFQSYCSTFPLPDGFEQTCDSKGNIYFIDHKNKQTYWNDPRPNYYRSLMTKRLDTPSTSALQLQDDPLSNKLTEILKERQALQLRTQELERMEADIRKRLNQRTNTNNQSLVDETALELLIDDLLLHQRQDSTDSGLDDGRCSINQTYDGLNSIDFHDNLLFPDTSDYNAFSGYE